MLAIVHDEGAPHVHRLIALRRRVLGLDRLYHYDAGRRSTPTSSRRPLSPSEAGPMLAALRPLGDEYGQIMAAAFRDRWVDWTDNRGKCSGAFCASVYGVHPYVLTAWRTGCAPPSCSPTSSATPATGRSPGTIRVIGHHPRRTVLRRGALDHPRAVRPPPARHHRRPAAASLGDLQFLGTFTHNMVTHLFEAHFEQRLYELARPDQPMTQATSWRSRGRSSRASTATR